MIEFFPFGVIFFNEFFTGKFQDNSAHPILIHPKLAFLLAVGEVWHSARQREKEQELLFVGNQFRRAISSYYLHAPAANKQQPYPTSLEDLLKDPRYPSTQRYLRKIYPDPISGSSEWV